MAGSITIFRPPLKRFTCLLRQGRTPDRFLELAAAQNSDFARRQFNWHTSRLPSGDSILVSGVEPGLTRFIQQRKGKIFCETGQVHFNHRVGPLGPPEVGPATPGDVEVLIEAARNSVWGRTEAVSLDWMVDRVRSHVALAADGLRRASSSTNVIPPGEVKTAVVAVEERVCGEWGCGWF